LQVTGRQNWHFWIIEPPKFISPSHWRGGKNKGNLECF
jgi:hypothetical protein